MDNNQKKLIFFLGELKAIIEGLTLKSVDKSVDMFEELTDLQTFFNKSMTNIFNEEETDKKINRNINKKISGSLEITHYG
jgi:hypothetical protein